MCLWHHLLRWFHSYILTPTLIKLYTLNMYRFLYVNHSSIKWWKTEGKKGRKEERFAGCGMEKTKGKLEPNSTFASVCCHMKPQWPSQSSGYRSTFTFQIFPPFLFGSTLTQNHTEKGILGNRSSWTKLHNTVHSYHRCATVSLNSSGRFLASLGNF